MKNILLIGALLALGLTACKKDDSPGYNASVSAALSVEFDNIEGASDLQLNTGVYTNASNEELRIATLKYYVSNFVLTNVDGSVYTVPRDSCYFLIDESDETTHEPILHVPEGEYKTISFLVGVDSAKSAGSLSGRTGVLDPAGAGTGMYRDMNSGYIFFKMEGTSPTAPDGSFVYNIGGYGGATVKTFNNIKKITLDLTARGTPKIKAAKETNIHLLVDVLKVFTGTTNVSIAANPEVQFTDFSMNVANNYSAMFRHDHTEN